MSDEPPDPAEAYTPFTHEEVNRLERYVARVHNLEQTTFIRDVKQIGWQLTSEVGKGTTWTLKGVDDKMLKETLMEFRPLWLKTESASFDKCQAFVKRHAKAKDSDAGREAIAQIKNHTRILNEIMDGPVVMAIQEQFVDADGNVVGDSKDVKPRRIFEDFMHGVYFHEDEARRARLEPWWSTEMQRYVFINTVHNVSHVYRSFSTIVEGILGEPTMRG